MLVSPDVKPSPERGRAITSVGELWRAELPGAVHGGIEQPHLINLGTTITATNSTAICSDSHTTI